MFGKNKENINSQAGLPSTQNLLDVSEVRDGIVILKDGNLRGLIAVSSVNFSLKSEDEQSAMVSAYQSFLNSLEHPIQILIQNRRFDIEPYLNTMRQRMAGQTNQLLQMQMAEYVEFIDQLTDVAHIMTKNFYVIVPHNINSVKEGILGSLGRKLNPTRSVVLDAAMFDEHKKELRQKLYSVSQNLGGIGLRCVTLDTAEIIELLYASYNIGAGSAISEEALDKLHLENPEKNHADTR
jgi:type IV secretory pathway VirB4 component